MGTKELYGTGERNCYQGNVACPGGSACDRGNGDAGSGTNQCVPPACLNVTCGPATYCTPAGTCAGYCDGVMCPPSEVCVPPLAGDAGSAPHGCVNLCAGVMCPSGEKCDYMTGKCAVVPSDGGLVLPDGSPPPPGDAGPGLVDGGLDGGGSLNDNAGQTSGCSCAFVAGNGDLSAMLAALGALGLVGGLAVRRRKR